MNARFVFGLSVALLAVPAVSLADSIPPDVAACNGKKAGDTCGSGEKCVAATCMVADYSDGSPPGSKTVDCLKCSVDGSNKGGCAIASSLGTWAIALIPLGALAFLKRRRR